MVALLSVSCQTLLAQPKNSTDAAASQLVDFRNDAVNGCQAGQCRFDWRSALITWEGVPGSGTSIMLYATRYWLWRRSYAECSLAADTASDGISQAGGFDDRLIPTGTITLLRNR
jgi:hypothetical protein